MKTALATLMMMGVVGIGGAASVGLARAETGPNVQLDFLCLNPAYANASHGIGLAGKNDYCKTDAVDPASYGIGHDADRDGVPDTKDKKPFDPKIQ